MMYPMCQVIFVASSKGVSVLHEGDRQSYNTCEVLTRAKYRANGPQRAHFVISPHSLCATTCTVLPFNWRVVVTLFLRVGQWSLRMGAWCLEFATLSHANLEARPIPRL